MASPGARKIGCREVQTASIVGTIRESSLAKEVSDPTLRPGRVEGEMDRREATHKPAGSKGEDTIMKKGTMALLALGVVLVFAGSVFAAGATKDECIAKTKEAAKMVNEKGLDAAVAEVNKKDGKFVWKDSYVFLVDFDGKVLAHPMSPGLIGKNVIDMKDKSDDPAKAKLLFKEFTEVAKGKGEGWSGYMWKNPDDPKARKKISYIYRVPGKDIYAGAGIWE